MRHRRCRPIVVKVAAILLAVFMGTPIARAGTECTVRLFPPGAGEGWRRAAKDVEEGAHALPSGSTDCAEILIEVAEGQASVTLVTRDGRRAVRPVSAPGEIAPTVEALFVTLPAPEPTTPSPAKPLVVASTPPADTGATPPPIPAAPAEEPKVRDAFTLGAALGGRFGFPGAFAAPGIALLAGGHVGHWEIGGRGEWNPVNTTLGARAPTGFRSSQVLFGLVAGRRESIGDVPIAFGLSAGATHLTWQSPSSGQLDQQGSVEGNDDGSAPLEGSKLEPRGGVYAGTWFPRAGSLRVRPELLFDVVVSRIGRTLATDAGVGLPWWSLGLALTVDGDLR